MNKLVETQKLFPTNMKIKESTNHKRCNEPLRGRKSPEPSRPAEQRDLEGYAAPSHDE